MSDPKLPLITHSRKQQIAQEPFWDIQPRLVSGWWQPSPLRVCAKLLWPVGWFLVVVYFVIGCARPVPTAPQPDQRTECPGRCHDR